MKALIVEDDFLSRRLMKKMLSEYCECDEAVNGIEALEAYKYSIDSNERYDLICLDIMMPEMNGQDVLKKIREYEKSIRIEVLNGVKIIMTTAVGDYKSIEKAFIEQCEGYLLKPIEKNKLIELLKELDIIEDR